MKRRSQLWNDCRAGMLPFLFEWFDVRFATVVRYGKCCWIYGALNAIVVQQDRIVWVTLPSECLGYSGIALHVTNVDVRRRSMNEHRDYQAWRWRWIQKLRKEDVLESVEWMPNFSGDIVLGLFQLRAGLVKAIFRNANKYWPEVNLNESFASLIWNFRPGPLNLEKQFHERQRALAELVVARQECPKQAMKLASVLRSSWDYGNMYSGARYQHSWRQTSTRFRQV